MNSLPSTTSISIIDLVKTGNEQAWSQFVHLYQPYIYAYARRNGLSPDIASEICQEVFCNLVNRMTHFEHAGRKGSLRKWLRVITHNTIVSHFRRPANQQQAIGGTDAAMMFTNIESADQGIDGTSLPPEERELLKRVMEMVKPSFEASTWQAFWRTTVDGQSSDAVAAETGKTPKAVRQAKYRVLTKIREMLGDRTA